MRPTCKVCGKQHYSHESHQFTDEPVKQAIRRVANMVANTPELVANKDSLVANSNSGMVANKESRHGKYADQDKRRQYMRDYMRRRRAQGD